MSSKADHESRYQQLASDIASRIAEGSYREGDKIFARSSLASQYQVSSETARRAICVLAELGIVQAEKGSGVTVKSRENALLFISRRKDARTLSFLKNSIAEKLEKQMKEIAELKEEIVERLTRVYLEQLLERTGGNRSEAARIADLQRGYLRRLLEKYGLA